MSATAEKPATTKAGNVEDEDRPINEAALHRKDSWRRQAVVNILFPGGDAEYPLPFRGDYLKAVAFGEFDGPLAAMQMLVPTYRSAEVILSFHYKGPHILYDLGRMMLPFSGIQAGAKPHVKHEHVAEDERFTVDEMFLLRLPITASAIYTTVNHAGMELAVRDCPDAASSVEVMNKVFGRIHKLRSDYPDHSVVFNFSLPSTTISEGLTHFFLRGFRNEANLPARFTELFSKAPKTKLLTTNGFATLNDEIPEPKMTFFHAPVNRKVALGYGSHLDHLYQYQHAEALESLDLHVVAFQLPNMTKKNVSVSYVFAIQGTSGLELMPPIDADVDITVHLPYSLPKAAENDIPLHEQQKRAHQHVRQAITNMGQKDRQSLLRKHIDDIVRPAANVQGEAGRQKFIDAVLVTWQMRRTQFIKVDGADDERIPGESTKEHLTRVQSFIDERWHLFRLPDTSKAEGFLRWSGKRIEAPHEMASLGGPFFYAEVPLHPTWPKGLPNRPRAEYKLPLVNLLETMQQTVAVVDNKKRFKVNVKPRVNDSNLAARLEGINKFDTTPELADLAKWHLDLRDMQRPMDFFRTFPFLKTIRDALDMPPHELKHIQPDLKVVVGVFRKLDDDQKQAFYNLASTNNGVWLLLGYPGSGKTHLCLQILASTYLKPVHSKMLQRESLSSDLREWDDDQTTQPAQGETNDTWSDVLAQDTYASTQVDQSVSRESPALQADIEAGNSGIPDATKDNVDETGEVVFPQIFIGVGQNLQGNDVAKSFVEICKTFGLEHVQVTRLNTITREERHIINTTPGSPPKAEFDEAALDFLDMSETMQSLDQVANMIKEAKRANSQLHGSEMNLSLTDRVRARIAHDDKYAALREAMATRSTDPSAWEQNKAILAEEIRKVTRACVQDTHVMVGTAVAARRLACKYPDAFKPAIILLEEGGRQTEADILVVLGHFPSVLYTFISGDPAQIRPHVFSRLAHLNNDATHGLPFINLFGEQMAMSVLERAKKADHPVSELTVNWRSHAGIESLCSVLAYEGRMVSGYDVDHEPAPAALFHHFMTKFAPKARGNIVFVDIRDDRELRDGLSFSNPQHATYVASLVMEMFAAGLCSTMPTVTEPGKRARILVMSPYRAQVSRLNTTIGRLSKFEYVQDLVDVRTVDTAMGDTADIAILDLTRSKEPGFTDTLEFLNVGVSRAKYGLVIVGNAKVAGSRKGRNLKKILQYCEQYNAVHTLYSHKILGYCPQCYGTEHKNGKPCRKPQTCANCGEKHHIRNCRTPLKQEMSIELQFKGFPGFKILAALQASDESQQGAAETPIDDIEDCETHFKQGFEIAVTAPKSDNVTSDTTQVDSSDGK